MFATCLTAAVVSLLAWSRLWWLVPIAALSYLLALVGYLACGEAGRHGCARTVWAALMSLS